MQYKTLGRTGMSVSTISFGAWAIGSAWGPVDDNESIAALHAAIDAGVNFIDTADVYGDGKSERLIARVKKERPRDEIFVATKAGRRLPSQVVDGYTRENLTAWIERSLTNLEVDALDLVQLHCPPSALYESDEVFGILDDLTKAGKIRNYGVSVEKVSEARRAILHPNVKTVQIIFNMFRLKPTEAFFAEAEARNIGILARVPLASGLLTGKFSRESTFSDTDHRQFNRHGERFDKGETFSGVPYDRALDAVDALRPHVPNGATMSQFALRWILMWSAVTCAIPGAKTPTQALDNVKAADLEPISPMTMEKAREIYDRFVREDVHGSW